MAIPTKAALRNPKKNIKTKTTKITPKMMLFSKSSTCEMVLSVISLVREMINFSGKIVSFALAIILSIFLETIIKFSPERFFTSNITTGLVNSLA